MYFLVKAVSVVLLGAETASMMFSMSTIISGCACARAGAASLHSLPPEPQESLITPHREEEALHCDHEGLLPPGEHAQQSG